MDRLQRSWSWSTWIVLASASVAYAQPAEPDQEPPPPAPEPNWAPPLPAEPPPGAPNEPPVENQANAPGAAAAGKPKREPTMEFYGHAMLDLGYDFGQIGDPAWEDVLRPTKLPSFNDQYGRGGRTFEGVRQSRFGMNAMMPSDYGDINVKFEFELFGVGAQAGQTTFRLRHFYGEWKNLRAGQTWSPFMDPDVFPDSIEYWGPNGMVFYRNVQLAYSFYKHGGSDITVALERPGASGDSDALGDRFDLTNVVPRFPAPDVSADAKLATSWGYLRVAAIFRYISWDDLSPTPIVQGHVYGWGVNLSSNVKLGPALLKLQAVYGSAIENYMNDAAFDVAPKSLDAPTSTMMVEGVGLPVLGLVGFVDMRWSDYLTSTAGYSFVHVENSAGQTPDAFHIGHYALGNVLIHPTKNLMLGPEFQFGRRTNNSDGFSVNDYRLQFSIKYSFAKKFGGQ